MKLAEGCTMTTPGVIIDSGSFVVTKDNVDTYDKERAAKTTAQVGLRHQVPDLPSPDRPAPASPEAGDADARITHAEAYLVDLAVETVRTDAVQAFLKQETVFVDITATTADTAPATPTRSAPAGRAVLALLRDYLLPRLVGADPARIEAIWQDLFAATRATTVGAITSLALAAVDTALWDWRCRRAGLPLWLLAGGAKTASRFTTPRAAGCT